MVKIKLKFYLLVFESLSIQSIHPSIFFIFFLYYIPLQTTHHDVFYRWIEKGEGMTSGWPNVFDFFPNRHVGMSIHSFASNPSSNQSTHPQAVSDSIFHDFNLKGQDL